MAPVESAGFRLREGEGEGGADIQRIQRVLVAQVSATGIFLCVWDFLFTANSILMQCFWGWRYSTGSSQCVLVIICIAPYLGLRGSFGGKLDDNRPTRQDGVGRKIIANSCTNKVVSFGCAIYGALEELVQVELGHTGSSIGRRPRASLRRAVRTMYVQNFPWKILLEQSLVILVGLYGPVEVLK